MRVMEYLDLQISILEQKHKFIVDKLKELPYTQVGSDISKRIVLDTQLELIEYELSVLNSAKAKGN